MYIVKIPISFLRSKFYKTKNKKVLSNLSATEELISKYKENIYFVNLKQKAEVILKKQSYETIFSKEFILKNSKNYFECDFNNNLNLYYSFDAHPNRKGYKYLYSCVNDILNKIK